MSEAAKMHLTEITVKQGTAISKFSLPVETVRILISLLRSLHAKTVSDTVTAENVFPNIKDPAKRIGIIFKSIRFKHNLTQAEVAKRLKIDQSDVSKIEKGKRSIGKALAKKIEKEFGIDYRRFL